MKTHILTSLFLIITIFPVAFNGYSQQLGDSAKNVEIKKIKKKPENKFSLNLSTGPQFTDISGTGNLYSSGKTGYFITFTVDYNLPKNLKIGTGLSYDTRGFGLFYYSPYIVFPDTISSKSYTVLDINYRVKYLTIPVNLKYIIGERKFKMIIQGTFYYSIFLTANRNGYTNIYIHPDDFQYVDPEQDPDLKPGNNKVEYDGNSNLFLGNEKFSNFDLGIIFYVGAEYEISDKLNIHLFPGFGSDFSRLLDNPEFKTIKWTRNIKIEFGVTYNLK